MSAANSTDANRKVSNKLTYLLTYTAMYAYRRHCTYSTTLCGPVQSFEVLCGLSGGPLRSLVVPCVPVRCLVVTYPAIYQQPNNMQELIGQQLT